MNRKIIAIVAPALLIASAIAGGWLFVTRTLPRDHQLAPGVRIDGSEIPTNANVQDLITRKAKHLEARQLTLTWQQPDGTITKQTRPASAWGLHVDRQAATRRVIEIARRGSIWHRLQQAWDAMQGRVDVPLTWKLSPKPLLHWVTARKERLDVPPRDAKVSFPSRKPIPHHDGHYANPYATLDALRQALRVNAGAWHLTMTAVPPVVTSQFLQGLDISQEVGHYETRFGYLGGQANRAHNVATAAARLDGVVLMPGKILSFNKVVGHRTIANGFAKGWEIFRGEMVEGVGGGTCQTASTLHAAWYLSGLDVIERSPHSRPSGYIPMGLDATVVDGMVDLKIRNPLSFPVVLHSYVHQGLIRFQVLGETRPRRVTFHTDVIGVDPYKRKLRVSRWLRKDKVIKKQKGIRGYTLRRVRDITDLRTGRSWEQKSTDHYPATPEIYLVPPGIDPENDLPPLPFDGE